jgi:hypothetical protein
VIPVEQRLFFNAETGQRGDCLKCCLASLLELDYDDVPHFASMGDLWWIEQTNWLASRGWRIGSAWYSADPDDPTKLTGWTKGYWLAGVTSLRTRPDGSHITHQVVMRDGEIVWDPHPARADGHLGFVDAELLIPLDPAAFVYVPRRDRPPLPAEAVSPDARAGH